MAKSSLRYLCSECGDTTPKWEGQCPTCRKWNTLTEYREPAAGKSSRRGGTLAVDRGTSAGTTGPVPLASVKPAQYQRMPTGIEEFDFVLGGGVVAGSLILLGGEPGIGKSTILGQVSGRLQQGGYRTLYVSGEENAEQVQMRAERLGEASTQVSFLSEPEVGAVLEHALRFEPRVLVIDSIQTIYDEEVEGQAGQASQLRACAVRLQRFAKDHNVAVFLIGHVTKEGSLAGPKTLEHVVDTVLYFEHAADYEHRIMRATKNRFGSINEIAVFRMTERGLESVGNPSALFLADRTLEASGSAVTALMEGSRPILVEIQALTTAAPYGTPQRVATGFSRQRLALILAVLEARAGLSFAQRDVFLNIVGGAATADPSADTAVAMALASALLDQPLPADALFLGEVGLGGEIRRTAQLDRRLGEAHRLGFHKAYVAAKATGQAGRSEIRVIGANSLREMVLQVLNPQKAARSAAGEERRAPASSGVGRKRLDLATSE